MKHGAAIVLALVASALPAAASVVRGIEYDDSGRATSRGDLFLPAAASADTPVVLVIHGGGWTSMCRADLEGIARFFCDDLGFAAFNVDYRLASPSCRWPACGDDCVAAARFVLSPRFAALSGLAPKKIWICGGSAGGHLVLWTALSLPRDKVAGAVAISPIGDPLPDFEKHPDRYRALLGEDASPRLFEVDPRRLIDGAGPPILITHAFADQVVPLESSLSFARAYSAAGGDCELHMYSASLEPNKGGHFIWRTGSKPNRLLASLERRIALFVRSRLPPRAAPLGLTGGEVK